MISIEKVSKYYNQSGVTIKALDNVSLHVEQGEIFGVVGASGAGKSTLIRCVNMLEKPTSGSIRVNGQEITSLPERELRAARQNIGMIFQHFNLLSSRTVAGNIAFPLEINGMDRQRREARVTELLELVGLTDKAGAYPSQLSGGQKQRVGIARALATQPQVLLSDEATSALDPQNTLSILNLLKDLNQRLGLTILLITHEMDVVRQICSRVAVLEDGRVVEQGSIHELAEKPGSFISENLFPLKVESSGIPGTTAAVITFIGDAADQPVLADLVRRFQVEVNILGGSIQSVAGKRIGQLQVELKGEQVQPALDHLRGLGLRVEVR